MIFPRGSMPVVDYRLLNDQPSFELLHNVTNNNSNNNNTIILTNKNNNNDDDTSWRNSTTNDERCALCFFGLPRAYKDMVLPSIVENVLRPNVHHNCDVYVHFYEQYEEAAGRKNRGGTMNPREILLLENATVMVYHQHHEQQQQQQRQHQNEQQKGGNDRTTTTTTTSHRIPHVAFVNDTNAQFTEKRGSILHKYLSTVGSDGKKVYFPWKAKTYKTSSLENIIKQWHSIDAVFQLMEDSAKQQKIGYSRVGMFRSDVMYLTPIDIFVLDKGKIDAHNNHVVVAPFARAPINDRMVYGPYEAVKIWSTKRFELVEERVQQNQEPGFVLHSERFLHGAVFPKIEAFSSSSSSSASGVGVGSSDDQKMIISFQTEINHDICFIRVRADHSAMISDCNPMMSGSPGATRGWKKVDTAKLVETIVDKNCTRFEMGHGWKFVGCRDGTDYQSSKQ